MDRARGQLPDPSVKRTHSSDGSLQDLQPTKHWARLAWGVAVGPQMSLFASWLSLGCSFGLSSWNEEGLGGGGRPGE